MALHEYQPGTTFPGVNSDRISLRAVVVGACVLLGALGVGRPMPTGAGGPVSATSAIGFSA